MGGCGRSVVVGGIPPDVSKDYLQSYFAIKCSIEEDSIESFSIDRNTSTAVVTFADLQVVNIIISKDHELDGKKLQISKLESETIITDQITIEHQKVLILEQFLNEAKQKHPKVKFDFESPESLTLCLVGRYLDIQEAKKYIQNFLRTMPRRVVNTITTTKKLLHNSQTRDAIKKRVNEVCMSLEVADKVVCLYAILEGDLEVGVKAIHDEVKELSIHFQDSKKKELKSTLHELEKKFIDKFSYEIRDNILEMSFTWDVGNEVMSEINHILQAPSTKNETTNFKDSSVVASEQEQEQMNPLEPLLLSHAVTVDNLDPASQSNVEKLLEYYFENKGESNGGSVDNIILRENGKSAVVSFSDREAAERVVKQKKHVLSDMHLQVTPLHPRPLPPLFEGPVEANVLLLIGAPFSADKTIIQDFVGDSAGCSLVRIIFAVEPGKAMLTFAKEPRYVALRDHCTRYPMLDSMVQVQRVPQCKSIQIFGFRGNVHSLKLYFEDTKNGNGGGEVESAEGCKEFAIVTFRHKITLDSVLSKDHEVFGIKIQIRKFFSCLGVLPPNHNDSLPGGPMPTDVYIDVDDQEVLLFLIQTPTLHEAIKCKLEALDCQVAWSPDRNGQLILQNTVGFSGASTEWEGKVKTILGNELSKFTSERMKIAPDIWDEFKARINDQEKVKLTLSDSDSSCIIVGDKNFVKKYQKELESMVEQLIKENEFCKRIITYKIRIQEHWQKTQLLGQFLQETKQKFPNVNIGFESAHLSKLCFVGRYAKIIEAKTYVQNFLSKVR